MSTRHSCLCIVNQSQSWQYNVHIYFIFGRAIRSRVKTGKLCRKRPKMTQNGYCEHEDKVDSRNEIELRNDKCSFKWSLKEPSRSCRLIELGTWGNLFMGISCSATEVTNSGRMVERIGPGGVDCAWFINKCVIITWVVVAYTTWKRFSRRACLIDENIIDSTSTDG